jgi:hypothetical protein
MYIRINIHVERERERERESFYFVRDYDFGLAELNGATSFSVIKSRKRSMDGLDTSVRHKIREGL